METWETLQEQARRYAERHRTPCKEIKDTKNQRGDLVRHLCARSGLHEGLHECFCGVKWRRHGTWLCEHWKKETGQRYDGATANRAKVSEQKELELLERPARQINLNE